MQWNARHTLDPTTTNYRHPKYQTLQSRLSSFSSWPQHMVQTPQQLADAGLFYTGFEDQVRCFACDGGLRRWDPDDDPWTEHCRWFPGCPFARQQKGDEYIALIQAAVAYEDQIAKQNGAQSGDQDLSGAMEQMLSRKPEFRAAMNEHMDTCLDMGYQLEDFNEAVSELRNGGSIKPTIVEVIDEIEMLSKRGKYRKKRYMPYEMIAKQNGAQSGDQDLSGAMEQMLSRKPEFRAAMNEHMDTCLDMGYQLEDFNEAVSELRNGGSIKPTIVEVIDEIEMLSKRGKYRKKRYMPYEMVYVHILTLLVSGPGFSFDILLRPRLH
ncbi:inhibitor of apoptosis protein-like, partial [Mercenaria mercenaria]|uniref:inhibitor of apoptosis protein-like n=1 Tax=Mercenaria mercenaria TaxID=6596 RepID=UPI00234F9ABF